MEIQDKKRMAASLSIISNIALTLMKVATGLLSGSLSIISEALHSLTDFAASVITFFSVTKSSVPADEDHPYGHGKYEDMAGFIEGLLIVAAALFIIYKSVIKILLGGASETENTFGIIVMLMAVVINYVVSSVLLKIAKESNSISLYADGEHLRTDVYSSAGVLVGLILIKLTGKGALDPIIAMLVAVLIYRTGYNISKKAWRNLMDHSLPAEDIDKIKSIIEKFSDCVKLKKNSIKTRQVGPSTDIDFILQFPEDTTICECHKICDKIEKNIRKIYVNSSISIHSEPVCYKKCCTKNCVRKSENNISA